MQNPQPPQPPRTLGSGTIWLLLGIVVLLAVVPLFLHPESEFGGADTAAKEALIERGVEPWFTPLIEPPGTETESFIFALQAAAGAGIIGYFLGLRRGEARSTRRDDEDDDDD
jgi:cobalt/nickel transport protein